MQIDMDSAVVRLGCHLMPRERELLMLVLLGEGTRDIAANMGITYATVNTYLKRIYAKANVRSREQLTARALGVTA